MIKKRLTNTLGLKIIFFMCIVIPLLAGFVYSYEWDNTKSYDSKDRSITVSNSFLQLIDLDAIAKVTPTTPHVMPVIRGKDRLVAEFEIESYLTYKEKVWDGMKFYNFRNGKELHRDFIIRYQTLEPYDYYTHGEKCEDMHKINKTDGKPIWKCEDMPILNYGHKKVWRDLDTDADLPKGTMTVGIFTDVLPNDNVEFVPTWFGVSMPEYAVWTDSYNVGLKAYFDGNGTANMITSNPQANLSNHIGTPSAGVDETCLIGKCINTTASANWQIKANSITNFSADYTWNFWVKGSNTGTSGNPFFMCYDIGTGNTNMGWDSPTAVYVGASWTGIGSGNIGTPAIGEWFMVTVRRNNTDLNATIYYNGIPQVEGTTGVLQDYQSNLILGGHCNGIFQWQGHFDELGYWNRTLGDLEILDLYNGGAGLTYDSEAAPLEFSITLNYPSNGAYLTKNNSYYNSTASLINGNLTNATLHIWNATTGVEFTNFTAIAGFPSSDAINLSYTLPNGFWKWNVEYCGQDSLDLVVCSYASTNFTFEMNAAIPNFKSWNKTFNEGLVAYFDGNTTVNMIVPYPQINLSSNEGSPLAGSTETCLIGKCLNVTEGNNWKIRNNFLTNYTGNYTFNLWVRGVSSGVSLNPHFLGGNDNGDHQMGWDTPSSTVIAASSMFTGHIIADVSGGAVGHKRWFMITVTGNGNNNNVSVYFNGTLKSSDIDGTPKQHDIYLGNIYTNALDWQGQFDEIAWWNRTLSQSEVNSLYNLGAGMTYEPTVPELPVSLAVQLNYPPNSVSDISSHYFNSSAWLTNGNLTNATLHIWNATTGVEFTNFTAIAGFPSSDAINLSYTLPNGFWKWNVEYCGENATNVICNFAPANNTLLIDTISPLANITYPMNTSYTYLVNSLNFTLNETNADTCRFDNMTLNQTISCTLNVTGINSHQGSNKWIIWINDTIGHGSSSRVTFLVDSLYPLIEFAYPTPIGGANLSVSYFTVAVNVVEDNLQNITFYLYNSTHNLINESLSYPTQSYYNLPSGVYYYNVTATDSFNNQNSTETRSINLDTELPAIFIYEPMQLGFIEKGTNTSLKYYIFDSANNFESCWYFYNTTNFSRTGFETNTLESWNSIDGAPAKAVALPCFNGTHCFPSVGSYGVNISNQNSGISKNFTMLKNISFDVKVSNNDAGDNYNISLSVNGVIYNFTNPNQNTTLSMEFANPIPYAKVVIYSRPCSSLCSYTDMFTIDNIAVSSQLPTMVNCTSNTTFLLDKQNYLWFFANHTVGGYNFTQHYWNYTLFASNYSYSKTTFSGFTEPFAFNFSLDSAAFTGLNVMLSYNGVNYTMTSSDLGDDKKYTYSLITPPTLVETNRLFWFTIALTNASGTSYYETKTFNQTVIPFSIGGCPSGSKNIMNLRMIDEENLQEINGTIEITISLYTLGTTNIVNTYNATLIYDGTTAQIPICTSNFSGAFKMAYVIRHYGNQTTYFKKFREIQNQTIYGTSPPINLTLYNLLYSSGYSFVIKARDRVPNSNLLVEAYKQYVGLDNYTLVESSITDTDGNTILHLTPSSVNYRFIVSYEGQVISIFNNQQMICNNLATLDCQATLSLASSLNPLPDYTSFGNILGSNTFNITSQILEFSFVSADGLPHVINSYVIKSDGYGNTTICNGTYTGTAGSIPCVIPAAYSNSTICAYTFSDGNFIGVSCFSNFPKQNWYGADIILELLMFSSLVLLLIAHPILIVVGALLGLFFSIMLIMITDGSLTSIISSLIFYGVAGIIIIYHIGRRL